jgi:hypothetical protein
MFHQRSSRVLVPVVLPALVVVALITSACGSSTPTADQFNTQANDICRTYTAKLKSVSADLALPKTKNDKSLEAALSDALSLVQQGTSKLEGLARPAGEGGLLSTAFADQNAQTRKLQNLIAAVRENDQSKIDTAEAALEQSEAPLNQKFDQLGLTDCGSGTAPPANGTK